MQQHLMQMQPMMAAYYPNNVTTDHIQQYLDENKSLILKIVESQNSGKLSECAENQARLQRNLMYLAAIADSQPQPPAIHAQYPTSSVMQAGGAHYMQQHQQAAQQQQQQQMSPQAIMAARSSMLYAPAQPFTALQQQAMHGGMTSGGGASGLHMLQGSDVGGVQLGGGTGGFPDYGRGEGLHRGMGIGAKQDIGGSGSGSADGRGGSSGGDSGENLYLKGGDDGN